MSSVEWRRVYGVRGDEVVEIEALKVPEGWLVRENCRRYVVGREMLSTTRAAAEMRLRALRSQEFRRDPEVLRLATMGPATYEDCRELLKRARERGGGFEEAKAALVWCVERAVPPHRYPWPCRGGAWGAADRCQLHEGLPIGEDGWCVEGRRPPGKCGACGRFVVLLVNGQCWPECAKADA